MNKSIKHHLGIIKYWLDKISNHNNKTKDITENLEMALLNLKIQQAHLGDEARGILPIADLIEKSIKELHDSTKELVSNGRKELRESYNEIEKYINIKEGD